MATNLHKELPKVIATETLPAMFKGYKNINDFGKVGGQVSSWIAWRQAGEEALDLKFYDAVECHARMIHNPKGATDVITGVPHNGEADLAYIRMLIHGPFKAMSDHINLVQDNKYHYLHLTGLDVWPANVLYNFCIASRVPIEHVAILKPFMAYMEEGYDPTLSFLVAAGSEGNKKGMIHNPVRYGHYWLDTLSDWKRVLSGTFTAPSVSFTKDPTKCRPCNVIWGRDEVAQTYEGKVMEDMAKLFDMPKYVPPPPIEFKVPKLKKAPGQLHPQVAAALAQLEAQHAAVIEQVQGAQPPHWANPAWHIQPAPAGGIHDEIVVNQVNPFAEQPIHNLDEVNAQEDDDQPDVDDEPFNWDDDDDF